MVVITDVRMISTLSVLFPTPKLMAGKLVNFDEPFNSSSQHLAQLS